MDPRLHHALVTLSLPALLVALRLGSRFLPDRPPRPWIRFRRGWSRLARRPLLTAALLCALPLSACLYKAILSGPPMAHIHDEFSYLLAGETFASGRMTNPAHPMWVHFESFHIIHVPTYMSMYPPLQGLVLALGLLMGHAWIGVVLSSLLAVLLLWWAARQWLPPRWALLAGLFGTLLFTGTYWSLSYWGGAANAAAGALVAGSAGVLRKRFSGVHLFLYVLGVVLCANSRPYEGSILCASFSLWLLWLAFVNRGLVTPAHLRATIPSLLLVCAGISLTLVYFKAVTGNPFRMPYQEAARQYFAHPALLVGTKPAPPSYRHDLLRNFYAKTNRASPKPLTRLYYNFRSLQAFYLGDALFMLFPLAVFVLRRTGSRAPILAALLGAAAMIPIPNFLPHYFSIFAACFLVACCQSLRDLAALSIGGRPGGWIIVTSCFALVVSGFAAVPDPVRRLGSHPTSEWARQRAAVEQRLLASPGEDLVFVRYGPDHVDHFEWVYNHAGIDASPIVWARSMDAVNDAALRRYFATRRAWIVEADATPPLLTPYPESSANGPLK